MESSIRTTEPLNLKRGLLTFILAYVAVTILAFGLYLTLAATMRVSLAASFDIRNDPAYAVAERLYPILNFGVWSSSAWLYFRKSKPQLAMRQGWELGALWLAIAAPLDLVYFVLIPNPLQVDAWDFYVEQFPWIYATYMAVLVAPTTYIAASQHLKSKRA